MERKRLEEEGNSRKDIISSYRMMFSVIYFHISQLKMLFGQTFYHQDGRIFGLQSAVFTSMIFRRLWEAFVSIGSGVMRKSFGITEDETAVHVMELLGGIKYTRILSLSDCTMAVLGYAYDDNLPIFSNLIHLKLEINFCFGWKLLTPFLNNSPNLQVLILDMNKSARIQRVFSFDMYNIIYEDFDWIESENVPCCLLLHVKIIKITKMQREVQQLEVAKYLLENSKVLEKFSVEFSDSELKEDFQNEILKHRRGSKSCTIELL